MIKRIINLGQHLEKNKVLVIYGPRQVGKTTLIQTFLKTTTLKYKMFTGDEIDIAQEFSSCELRRIKRLLGDSKLLVIDEAQKIAHIGRALKLIVDHVPDIYVIATGSSSFDLANATSEPLTGRKNVLTLYPLSLQELSANKTVYELNKDLPECLIYGTYPNVVTYVQLNKKQQRITEIKDAYLIKDILEFHKVKNAKTVIDLLKLLAFQVGSEVSTVELGQNLGLDHKTVTRHLDLLEKSFVIFNLRGFSRNLRKEVSKMQKYYFFDLGIRNALISNFNHLETRNDLGQLWENLMAIERMKRNAYKQVAVNYYFWRTYDQKEIDLIEERGGKLYGYEFKWKPNNKLKPPKDWLATYDNASYKVITPENYARFVL